MNPPDPNADLIREVDERGTVRYRNSDGKLHREDGPAVEYPDGTRQWYLNGQLHRQDGPAIEWANNTHEWYRDGVRHREDGPAYERADGTRYWYLNGKLHRQDGPAYEHSNGTRFWYLNDEQLTEAEFEARRPISSTPSFSRDQFMDWAELDEEDLEHQFCVRPTDRTEMSANINTVLEAMAAHGEAEISWSPVFDVPNGAVDGYGFLEDSQGRIVRTELDDLAEWDQTSGWDQVLSIHRGVLAAFRQ